jgi:nitrous oxide reductase accessory protein NosL
MKKLIYLIFALSLLLATSCKTSQKQNDTTPSPNNLIQKDSTSDATGYTDTLDLCDQHCVKQIGR